MLRTSLAFAVLVLAGIAAPAIVACDAQPQPVVGDKSSGDDDDDDDSKADDDAAADDDDTSTSSSPCPKAPVITPDDLPSGFLPPVTVTLKYVVDGDTAHFIFPGGVETIVRFLWVNTEESHGAETTPFGTATAERVTKYFAAGKTFVVAPEEGTTPGTAHLDPYDRTLALVFMDGTLFQTRLVAEGLSAYYTSFGCASAPIHESLLYSEAAARAKKLGIWEEGHPTDYAVVLKKWIGSRTCRPNPYTAAYCP